MELRNYHIICKPNLTTKISYTKLTLVSGFPIRQVIAKREITCSIDEEAADCQGITAWSKRFIV